MLSYQHMDSQYEAKTVARPSYLYNRNPQHETQSFYSKRSSISGCLRENWVYTHWCPSIDNLTGPLSSYSRSRRLGYPAQVKGHSHQLTLKNHDFSKVAAHFIPHLVLSSFRSMPRNQGITDRHQLAIETMRNVGPIPNRCRSEGLCCLMANITANKMSSAYSKMPWFRPVGDITERSLLHYTDREMVP